MYWVELMNSVEKTRIHGRHGARWVAIQGLYAWALSHAPIAQIEADIHNGNFEWSTVDVSFDKAYLHELLVEVTKRAAEWDESIIPYIERPLAEINPIEHAILRLAIYELKEKKETPYRVVLNEAILLAKEFGATDSHKFINGVLDKVARGV